MTDAGLVTYRNCYGIHSKYYGMLAIFVLASRRGHKENFAKTILS